MDELARGLDELEADDAVGCLVVTGSEKAFAAGADIKEMQAKSYMDVYKEDFITARWEHITRIRKQIGRASCRERVCQSGQISVVAVSLKKKNKQKKQLQQN